VPAQVLDFNAELPVRIYWDASFLVHATYPAARYHPACHAFLRRLSAIDDCLSYVSTLALDETIFALLQLKAAEDYPDRGFWDLHDDDPRFIAPYLGELRALTKRLTADPRIQIVGQTPGSMLGALDRMEDHGLLPRDALHLVAMQHHGIRAIVTTDQDFLAVENLTIYTCNPTILAAARP